MNCPGKGACHGGDNWCDECGDVSLVCDDPKCMTHERESEVWDKVVAADYRYRELQGRANHALAEVIAALDEYKRTRHERVRRMVARNKGAAS